MSGICRFFYTHHPSTMWRKDSNALVKEFSFKDFREAFVFMTKVAFWQKSMGITLTGRMCTTV